MVRLGVASRVEALAAMADDTLDVLVIGGGITGAGVALDAVARGYRTGLLERRDFASGTSRSSTKLVHGGIRYLPQLDVPLVREALVERGRLLRNAPHLVQPLSFILPLYADARRPVGLPIAPPLGIGLGLILNTGLTFYDGLAGGENIAPHHRLSSAEIARRAPCLKSGGLKTGFAYFDAQTDDTRLTISVLRAAADRGALLANYCAATGFLVEGGVARGVVAESTLETSPEKLTIRARYIVNATGVWAEETERLAGESPMLDVVPSKGTHLVFPREIFDLNDEAIVLPETEDGRILFIVPWLGRALVGTTDEEAPDLRAPVATEMEIDYILNHLNRFLRASVTRDDIVATYSGYRPLLKLRSGGRTPARLSRSHAVVEGADGLISVSGGKLTTYRRMAQDVLDRIDGREGRHHGHPTAKMLLYGATGWFDSRSAFLRRAGSFGLDHEVTEHLSQAYGTAADGLLDIIEARPDLRARLVPDLPYVEAEVVYVCVNELALTVEDVLARRTHIAILDRSRGSMAAERVAELMAATLDWSAAEKSRQMAAYYAFALQEAGPLGLPLPRTTGTD